VYGWFTLWTVTLGYVLDFFGLEQFQLEENGKTNEENGKTNSWVSMDIELKPNFTVHVILISRPFFFPTFLQLLILYSYSQHLFYMYKASKLSPHQSKLQQIFWIIIPFF
jgi:hypothetical protein